MLPRHTASKLITDSSMTKYHTTPLESTTLSEAARMPNMTACSCLSWAWKTTRPWVALHLGWQNWLQTRVLEAQSRCVEQD